MNNNILNNNINYNIITYNNYIYYENERIPICIIFLL